MSDLRFDPSKHDSKIADLRAGEAKQKALALVQTTYQNWQRELKRKIKRKEITTAQDLISAVYDLQSRLGKIIGHASEMQEFRRFCFDMLDDKVGEIVLTSGWAKNMFSEFVPTSNTAFTIPQRFAFGTYEEFEEIPSLKSFKQKDGFIGFVRDSKAIYAWFRDDLIKVGVIANSKGIEKLPTLGEVRKELGKKK